jgi:hypothetical protein
MTTSNRRRTIARAIQGEAPSACGEGILHDDGVLPPAPTAAETEGPDQAIVPASWKGGADDSGALELFIESRDSALLENCDNVTMSPWGDLVLCEDRAVDLVRLVAVTPRGELYTLAGHRAKSEFAGATFTPDGSTLLVNIQHRGLTVATPVRGGRWVGSANSRRTRTLNLGQAWRQGSARRICGFSASGVLSPPQNLRILHDRKVYAESSRSSVARAGQNCWDFAFPARRSQSLLERRTPDRMVALHTAFWPTKRRCRVGCARGCQVVKDLRRLNARI